MFISHAKSRSDYSFHCQPCLLPSHYILHFKLLSFCLYPLCTWNWSIFPLIPATWKSLIYFKSCLKTFPAVILTEYWKQIGWPPSFFVITAVLLSLHMGPQTLVLFHSCSLCEAETFYSVLWTEQNHFL